MHESTGSGEIQAEERRELTDYIRKRRRLVLVCVERARSAGPVPASAPTTPDVAPSFSTFLSGQTTPVNQPGTPCRKTFYGTVRRPLRRCGLFSSTPHDLDCGAGASYIR